MTLREALEKDIAELETIAHALYSTNALRGRQLEDVINRLKVLVRAIQV